MGQLLIEIMSTLDIIGYCQIQGDSIVSIVFKSLDSANNFYSNKCNQSIDFNKHTTIH
jgi:hypothetical protein